MSLRITIFNGKLIFTNISINRRTASLLKTYNIFGGGGGATRTTIQIYSFIYSGRPDLLSRPELVYWGARALCRFKLIKKKNLTFALLAHDVIHMLNRMKLYLKRMRVYLFLYCFYVRVQKRDMHICASLCAR